MYCVAGQDWRNNRIAPAARILAIWPLRKPSKKIFALDSLAVESGQARSDDFDFLGDAFIKEASFEFPVEFRRTPKS